MIKYKSNINYQIPIYVRQELKLSANENQEQQDSTHEKQELKNTNAKNVHNRRKRKLKISKSLPTLQVLLRLYNSSIFWNGFKNITY